MKIGIDASCLEPPRGGVARILTNMLLRWPRLTDRHRYVLYFPRSVPGDDFLKHPQFECKVVRGPHFNRRILVRQVFLPLEMAHDRLDLFFAPWYYAPLVYPNRLCPKTIVAAWDISYSTHKDHYSIRARLPVAFFSERSCRRASGVFTCSRFDGQQIERYYGIPADQVCVLRLAAEEKFKPVTDPGRLDAVRRRYGLPKRYILSLGMIFKRRNVDVIIDAFTEIAPEYPDMGLVVIGGNETSPRIDIKGRMAPLVAKGQGLYLPRLAEEDLVEMYAGAWYYICTSTVDGETIMLKEAMKCGTPVITSPLLSDSVGPAALMIKDPTSRAETAEVLRKAVASPELRAHYAAEGLRWVEQFSWDEVAKDSLRFLESR